MPSLNREFFVVLFSHGSLWAAVCPRLPRFPQRWSQIALTRALVFISRWLLRARDWCGSSPNSGTHCFKTTYLSYECFIQETKYELAFESLPQERCRVEDSCMLITEILEFVGDGETAITSNRKQTQNTSNHPLASGRVTLQSSSCVALRGLLLSVPALQVSRFGEKLPETNNIAQKVLNLASTATDPSNLLGRVESSLCSSDMLTCRICIQVKLINIACVTAGLADSSLLPPQVCMELA